MLNGIAVEARNLIVLSSTPFIETTQGFPICIAMSAIQARTTPLLILFVHLCLGLSNNAMLLKNYIDVQKSTKRVTVSIPCARVPPKETDIESGCYAIIRVYRVRRQASGL